LGESEFYARAWYSIAKEIVHGENRVQILLPSGQGFFQSFARSLQSSMTWRGLFAIVLGIALNFSLMLATQAAEPTSPTAQSPQSSPEPSLGSKIFTANCAACHIGGNNVILAEKNLSKDALAKYSMDSIAAIKTQITNGKNAMPAFGDNLTSAEIEAVARYVLTQSQQEWKGSTVGLR
jgi:cytochrome c6